VQLVKRVSLDLKVLVELVERQELLELLEQLDSLAGQAQRVTQEPLVQLDLRAT